MTPDEKELVRLQALFSLWPSKARDEFKTELHLRSALKEAYDRVYSTKREGEG